MLEIRRVAPEWVTPLRVFFAAIQREDNSRFHPHPFTDEYAEELSLYSGKDLYYLLVNGTEILGYGMLRGWDEGYEVPSLGIAIHPNFRGRGLGELMMRFLHDAARFRGAHRIRLKVYPENIRALELYKRLGYRFDPPCENAQLVGLLQLRQDDDVR